MVTLKDVAHEAQVSISTVSAVLGGRAEKLGIKEETRRKVLLTARKLRYRRNGIAAQMKSGRATTLVLLLSDTTQEFVFQVAAAACAEAERHGCFVKLLVTESGEGFRRQLDSVIGQCPAGLLHWANAYENTPLLEQAARECRLPLIYLDSCDSSAAGCVRTDEVDGIRQGIRHLVELGHRRIAHVTDTLPANYARERLDGFRKVMAEFRLPVVEENIFHERQENQKEQKWLLKYLKQPPETLI